MPRAPVNLATRRPTLPMPTMPRVLPPSSVLEASSRANQLPARVPLSTSTARLTHISISIRACSATACEFEPGACTTATPRRVAAGMSTMSSPAPWRPTTFSFGQAAMRPLGAHGLAAEEDALGVHGERQHIGLGEVLGEDHAGLALEEGLAIGMDLAAQHHERSRVVRHGPG